MLTRRTATGAALLLVVAVGIFAADDSNHHTSIRYLVWRTFAIGSWEYGVLFLNVDPDFRESFVGKNREHLRRWFAELVPGSSRPPVCSDSLAVSAEQRDGDWIGHTPWLVVYGGGAVKDIRMVKGCSPARTRELSALRMTGMQESVSSVGHHRRV